MTPAARTLLDFIAKTETGKDRPACYDVVFGHNRMPRPLTSMTFDQVVKDGPRRTKAFGSSAAGAYQFMRNTLDAPNTTKDLKGELGLTGREKFDAALQDRLGLALLDRRGFFSFLAGRISRQEFGKRLAQEWASFPMLAAGPGAHRRVRRGETYYAGDKLNKALVKPETVEAVLDKVKAMAAAGAAIDNPIVIEKPVEVPVVVDPGELEQNPATSKTVWTWLLTALGAPIAAFAGLDWRVQLVIIAVIVLFAMYGIKRRFDLFNAVKRVKAELGG